MATKTRHTLGRLVVAAVAVCVGTLGIAAASTSDKPSTASAQAKPAEGHGSSTHEAAPPAKPKPPATTAHESAAQAPPAQDGPAKARNTSKATGASAREVVRRIENVMAAATQPPKSAAPVHSPAPIPGRTKPAPGKPRTAPLLTWGADLAPGNVALDWGEFQPRPEPGGVRLAWPADTAPVEKK